MLTPMPTMLATQPRLHGSLRIPQIDGLTSSSRCGIREDGVPERDNGVPEGDKDEVLVSDQITHGRGLVDLGKVEDGTNVDVVSAVPWD